jgi:hypothetical protein
VSEQRADTPPARPAAPEPEFVFHEDPLAPPGPSPAVIGALVDFLLRRVEEERSTRGPPQPP